MPGDLPAWLWLLAFLVLQFSYSCFPPPRPPRPPLFTTPPSTTSASTPATPSVPTTGPTTTSPDATTAPTNAATTLNSSTTSSPSTTTSTATGTCNTTVFSESSLSSWPASNVLIESQDAQDDEGRFNYWLGDTNGQFVLALGCLTQLKGIDLVNTQNIWARDRATKRFRLLGSITSTGPFELILEEELPDSRKQDVVPTISFTFQATSLQYVQFLIVDVWGRGGGLQYLGLVTGSQGPATTTLSVTTTTTTTGSATTSLPANTTTTTTGTTTSPLTWESGSTSVVIEDGPTYDCDIIFDFAFYQGVFVKNAKASCSEGTSSPNAIQFAGQHSFDYTSASGLILECSIKVVLVKNSLPSNVLDDSLDCSPKDSSCFTTSGQIYPAPCVLPFIHNKRRYKACTDVGSKDPEKLWCPTEVDGTGEAVPGQEGFCSDSCGFCSGTDVTSRADEPRPCGYDCLISARWYSLPILSPVITLEAPMKDNYLKESAGQHSLNMGDQVVKLSCPDTHFYANALKDHQQVFATCGPTQYRFTVSSSDRKVLDNASPNRNFGCDPCPTGYGLILGYFHFKDFQSSGVFFNIDSPSSCGRLCNESCNCNSFLFRSSTGWCELISDRVVKATVEKQYSDYIICSAAAAPPPDSSCCPNVTISSCGGTAEHQAARLGEYKLDGEHNGKARYKQEDGSKILFYSELEDYGWVVGSSVTSGGGLRTKPDPSSRCPNETAEWEYYVPGTADTWLVDSAASVACSQGSMQRIKYEWCGICTYSKYGHSKCIEINKPICEDRMLGKCQPCLNDDKCREKNVETPRCRIIEPRKGQCVKCVTNDHCPNIDRSKCSKEKDTCEACAHGSNECKHIEDTPHCKEGKCVACLDDNHCGANFCNNEGACVGCYKNEQCKDLKKSWCQIKTATCKICSQPTDCTLFTDTPACARIEGCVQCTTNQEDKCKGTNKRYCSDDTYECQICMENDHCKLLSAQLPYCRETRDPITEKKTNVCVACNSDSNCKDPTLPFCNNKGTCTAVCAKLVHPDNCETRSTKGQFVGGNTEKLICHSIGECRECENKGHCKGKKEQMNNAFACNPATSRCVQCTGKADCNEYRETNTISAAATNAYACNAANICVQCMVNADCQFHRKNWNTCNGGTNRCETRLRCIGFTLHPRDPDKAPELKILNDNGDEKISFHFAATANPTFPSTVNCPYRDKDGTKQWYNVDNALKQYYLNIVAMCKQAVTVSPYVWGWNANANAVANTFFPHDKPNAQTAVITSTVYIPACFHQP